MALQFSKGVESDEGVLNLFLCVCGGSNSLRKFKFSNCPFEMQSCPLLVTVWYSSSETRMTQVLLPQRGTMEALTPSVRRETNQVWHD